MAVGRHPACCFPWGLRLCMSGFPGWHPGEAQADLRSPEDPGEVVGAAMGPAASPARAEVGGVARARFFEGSNGRDLSGHTQPS
eukprot:14243021-Alexandrium_andersonii.AAC.1